MQFFHSHRFHGESLWKHSGENSDLVRLLRVFCSMLFLFFFASCFGQAPGGNNASVDASSYDAAPTTPDASPVVFQDPVSQPAAREVDLLFIIDDSGGTLGWQDDLKQSIVSFLIPLKKGGLPDMHIGVVTSDLGAGSYTTITYCQQVGGDRGIMGQVGDLDLGTSCIGPGQKYVVDVEPDDCEISKDAEGVCSFHSCMQTHCDAIAGENETLSLATDEKGCPRCRNYPGTLTDSIRCLLGVGSQGCGFEQHLEAMKKALDEQETPENNGFLRSDSLLAIYILADEDDCSASKPDVIFNPDPDLDTLDSELGYHNSFRCFEFGVTCDINDRSLTGPRSHCSPREDQGALLYKISRYTSFLESIKDPSQTVVGALAGPFSGEVFVQRDAQDRPELQSTCGPSSGAHPGIRLRAFVEHFNEEETLDEWAFSDVCDFLIYSESMMGFGENIVSLMGDRCPDLPFSGCPRGPSGTLCSPCFPQCEVYLVEGRHTQQEATMAVPWCGHICQEGLCRQSDLHPCSFDTNGKCLCEEGFYPTLFGEQPSCAPLLYQEPPNQEIDSRLLDLIERIEPPCDGPECLGQASACYYLTDDTDCENGVVMRIVYGTDPPDRTFATGFCEMVATWREQSCDDGVDDDEDCLIDTQDPDCP